MAAPFTSITVQPAYGKDQILLRWQTAGAYGDWGVLVYRSIDGGVSWHFLNPDEECIFGATEYLDQNIPRTSKLDDIYYRLGAEDPDGEIVMSEPVAALGVLTRKELAIASRIIHEEFIRQSKSDGTPMLHFVPLMAGKRNPYYDPDVSVVRGQECKHAPIQSFGLPFEGGYGPPIATWVTFGQQKLEMEQTPDTAASVERRVAPARMLCYPRPKLDHLFVNPVTDERWVVGAEVTPYFFKAVVAVAYDTTLHLLNRTDTRYRLDISVLHPQTIQ